MKLLTFLSLVAMIGATPSASAQNATVDGAQSVSEALAIYVGDPTKSKTPLYSVLPKGEDYELTIDPNAFAALIPATIPIETMKISKFILMLIPQKDGTWIVRDGDDFNFDMSSANQTRRYVATGVKYRGVFDPNIMGFSTGVMDIDNVSSDSRMLGPNPQSPAISQSADYTAYHQDATTIAHGVGQTDTTFLQTVHGGKNEMTFPGGSFAISDAESSANGSLTKFRNKALLDLLAWNVRNSTIEAKKANEQEGRQLAIDVLPIFKQATLNFDVKALHVTAGPLDVLLPKWSGSLTTTGLSETANLAWKFQAPEIVIADANIPKDIKDLLPGKMDLDFAVSGFDLEHAAHELISDIDLQSEQPISNENGQKILAMISPTQSLIFRLSDFMIGNDDYEIKATSYLNVGFDGKVIGSLNVTVHGFDALQSAILKVGAGAPGLQKMQIPLAMAKGLAKQDVKGDLGWNVQFGANNHVVVNGVEMNSGAQ